MEKRLTFNEDEVNYDKYRPTYPSELYEDILNYSHVCEDSSLLEIGIGTGQATLPFLQFGAEVTAVELGDKLSAFVKEKYKEYLRFKVLNADFSSINIEENSLNLVYSATAFHWLPVPESYQKIKNSLKSGGVIALFWNHPFPNRDDDPSNTASRAIYQKYRPSDKKPREFSEQDCRKYVDALVENGFEDVEYKIYRRTRTLSTEEYIGLLNTYSDHRSLNKDLKLNFESEMRKAINDVGGYINIYDTIDLYLGRKR